MKKLYVVCGLAFVVMTSKGQVALSGGLSYSQNFDTLASTGASGTWADNSTLLGWYASKALPTTTAYTTYKVDGGTANTGFLYSYGTNGVGLQTDRALGSVSSGTPGTNAWGVRFQNDTALTLNSITVSYTGEQWRNGGNLSAQTMAFSYQVSSTPFTSPISAAASDPNFTTVGALSFVTPTVGATATSLDGNDPTNRTIFSNIVLTGVTVNPGQEILLRWYDINDIGSDHGFAVDDLSVNFAQVPEPTTIALGGLGLLGLAASRRRNK